MCLTQTNSGFTAYSKVMMVWYNIYETLRRLISVFKPLSYNELAILSYLKNHHHWHIIKNNFISVKWKEFDNNIIVRRDSSDLLVLKQVLIKKEYESFLKLIKNKNPKEKINCIIDAGANIGITSLVFHYSFPESSIFSIEPENENFSILEENAKNISNISTINRAVWNSNGMLEITHGFRDNKSWSKRVVNGTEFSDQSIEGITLQKLMVEYKIEEIDILKIDIEGSEKEIFLSPGIDELLDVTKFIAIEIHDEFDCRQLICDKLSEHNFYWTNSGELTIGYNRNLVKVEQ